MFIQFVRIIYHDKKTSNESKIAKFMGSIRGLPGSCRPQMGPMLAPWILLSGMWLLIDKFYVHHARYIFSSDDTRCRFIWYPEMPFWQPDANKQHSFHDQYNRLVWLQNITKRFLISINSRCLSLEFFYNKCRKKSQTYKLLKHSPSSYQVMAVKHVYRTAPIG